MRELGNNEVKSVSGGVGEVEVAVAALGAFVGAAIVVDALTSPYYYYPTYSYPTYDVYYYDYYYDPYYYDPYYYDEVVIYY